MLYYYYLQILFQLQWRLLKNHNQLGWKANEKKSTTKKKTEGIKPTRQRYVRKFCDFVKMDDKWWKSETVTNVNLARMAKNQR